jgi:DNA processing protein
MLITDDLKYWISFTRIPGFGKVRLGLLKNKFGSLEHAWTASKNDLLQTGLDKKIISNFLSLRDKILPDKELEQLEKYNIEAITIESPQYPCMLKEIADCPAVLFVRGKLMPCDELSIAVVGTRRATTYGRQVTEELVRNLALNKITIISGLAKGIDTTAHKTALEANGRTLAIFASGLDIVYPYENAKLAREIMEKGALISEHPLGVKPKAEYFPQRNRILSGMSRGVLIVESGETGGALITANFALEQDREVFAVPGSVYSPLSKGTNKLIQQGAKLVSDYMDILEELNLPVNNHQCEMITLNNQDEIESIIIKSLYYEPLHIDQICRNTELNIAVVQSHLTVLELKGLVKHIGNLNYMRCTSMK